MSNAVNGKITALQALSTSGLRSVWEETFGRPPPKSARRDMLLRALAYRAQEQAAGGLRPATRRRLARVAEDLRDGKAVGHTPPRLLPGTRLIREWNGETHVVEILADGFAWRGAYYSSLSAIARAITGVRWSGPRFFGLRDKRPSTRTEQLLRARDSG